MGAGSRGHRDRLVGHRLSPALLLRIHTYVSRVFVTGGSGVVGRALVERLVSRGDEVVALGNLLDEDALCRAMEGSSVAYNVAGVNALCVDDPAPMLSTNSDGPAVAVRAAARAGVTRVVHTSSAATIGEPHGEVGREHTPHRGWFLSTYERSKTNGERAAFESGRDAGVEVV